MISVTRSEREWMASATKATLFPQIPPTNLKVASSKLAITPIIMALIPGVMVSLFSGDEFLFVSYGKAIWFNSDG